MKIKHDDFCPVTRFHCDEMHCNCGAVSYAEDMEAIIQTFGRKLKNINRMSSKEAKSNV